MRQCARCYAITELGAAFARRSRGLPALWLCGLLLAATCDAQELEPRAYANAPVGLNFLIAGYAYSEGDVLFDPALRLENAEISFHSGLFAFVRSFEIAGRSAKVDFVAPYVTLHGTADLEGQPRTRDVEGWADPRLRLSVNLYGAPAMSLREISTYRQDLIVGASVQVSAPLGQYDTDRVVNIGTNRWAVKTEIGLSKAVGQWTLELMAAGALFGNNDQYFPNRTREQQPIYSLQAAAIYAFRSGVWIAAASTYYTGGRTSIDGVEGDNLQQNSRVGIILTLPVNRYNSLKLYANTGVFTRTGSDFDSAGLAWQYRWGGGL